MRYVDLAVAALIGVSAISGMVAWSPRSGDASSRWATSQVELRDRLLSYVQHRGVEWFLRTPVGGICAGLGGDSNDSFVISATVGGVGCGPAWDGSGPRAELTLPLLPRVVTLEAWTGAA